MEGFQSKMKLPSSGINFKVKQGVSSKITPLFLEFQNSGVFQNRGNLNWREFQTSPWNCLFLRSWVDYKESNQTERFPRLFYSKNLDYFRIAGISIWWGFRVKWNSRFLENFQAETGSFIQKIPTIFKIPEFRSILEPREYK